MSVNVRQLQQTFRALRNLSREATEDDAWFEPTRAAQLEFIPAVARSKRIVYAAKLTLCSRLMESGVGLPKSVAMLSRVGLLTRPYADFVRREARATGAEIGYVGDLDPFGLSIYLSLVAGGFDRDPVVERTQEVRYLGVSDPWLAICRQESLSELRHRKSGAATLQVPLTPFQSRHLEILEDSGIPWDAIVGPEAMGILRGGSCIALELACNPAYYGPGFMGRIHRYLNGPVHRSGRSDMAGRVLPTKRPRRLHLR